MVHPFPQLNTIPNRPSKPPWLRIANLRSLRSCRLTNLYFFFIRILCNEAFIKSFLILLNQPVFHLLNEELVQLFEPRRLFRSCHGHIMCLHDTHKPGFLAISLYDPEFRPQFVYFLMYLNQVIKLFFLFLLSLLFLLFELLNIID